MKLEAGLELGRGRELKESDAAGFAGGFGGSFGG
jgi:hypothetical protein